jgi:hypothetical protein
MILTRALGRLAVGIRYRYLFAVWALVGCAMLDLDIELGGVSLGVSFLTDIPASAFYCLQLTWIAAVDLIFVKGGLRHDRPSEGGWRAVVVLVKWLLLPVFLLHLLPSIIEPFDLGLIAILLFTAAWPLLVLIGWFFKPSDVPAH